MAVYYPVARQVQLSRGVEHGLPYHAGTLWPPGEFGSVSYTHLDVYKRQVLHIKDRAVFGQSGMMNFEMIFKQMYANGIKDYFVELEQMPDGRTQFAGVKDCADYLIKAPFVK